YPRTQRDRRSHTGELETHHPATNTIASPRLRTAHRTNPPRTGSASDGASGRSAMPLAGCEVEIADTLHLRLQVHSETLLDGVVHHPDQTVNALGGCPAPGHHEVGVLLRDRTPAHRQRRRPRRLHKPSRVAARWRPEP